MCVCLCIELLISCKLILNNKLTQIIVTCNLARDECLPVITAAAAAAVVLLSRFALLLFSSSFVIQLFVRNTCLQIDFSLSPSVLHLCEQM